MKIASRFYLIVSRVWPELTQAVWIDLPLAEVVSFGGRVKEGS